MKKYKFDKPIELKCWLCNKKLLYINSKDIIELELVETPEGYDIELFCPGCQKSCMFSFDKNNEHYYDKRRPE